MSQRSLLPAKLAPECVPVTEDTRERPGLSWDLSPLRVTRGKLDTFDFALTGAEHVGGIERKELGDLISCVTGERDRFERELVRMLAYPFRSVIVECSWQDIQRGEWRSKVSADAVIGSILGWQALGIPFLFPGNRDAAQDCARRMLYIVARRQWRLCRALAAGILDAGTEAPG